jgi:hypothetical protein
MARMQVGAEIESFVMPMRGISPGGSCPNAHAVDGEYEAIVRADMNGQMRRRRGKVEIAPEMEHDRPFRRRRRIRDPYCRCLGIGVCIRTLCRTKNEKGKCRQ